jgi:prophage regulatory protein
LNKPEQPLRLLPWPELERRVPYTRQHLSKLEKLKLFPRRVHIGGNRVAWLEAEIQEWIEARAAERDRAA